MGSQLRDPVSIKKVASFIKASMRDWEYARQKPDGATNIVLANVTNGAERETAHSGRN